MSEINRKYSVELISFFLLLTLATIVSPFLSLLILVILHCLKKRINSLVFATLSSFFLSSIIVSSEIGGDLLNYKRIYFEAYESNSLGIFVLSQRKEPLFTLLTWLLAGLTRGNFHIYLYILTFFLNQLFFQTLINFSRVLNFKQFRINTLLLLMVFFPFIFHLNGIIIRQNLAVVLLLYGYSRLITKYSLIHLILLISSVFIHFIAIIPLVLILFIELKLKLKTIFKIFGSILAIGLLFPIIKSLPFIDYLILRLSRSNDFYTDIDASNVRNMVVPNLIFLTTLFLAVLNLFAQNKTIEGWFKFQFSKLFLIYSLVFLFVFVWVPINVLEYRILLLCYFLFPLVLVEFLHSKKKLLDYYVFLLPLQIVFFFLYLTIRDEPNDYKDLIYLITSPFLK